MKVFYCVPAGRRVSMFIIRMFTYISVADAAAGRLLDCIEELNSHYSANDSYKFRRGFPKRSGSDDEWLFPGRGGSVCIGDAAKFYGTQNHPGRL